jgi:hypothetical protein
VKEVSWNFQEIWVYGWIDKWKYMLESQIFYIESREKILIWTLNCGLELQHYSDNCFCLVQWDTNYLIYYNHNGSQASMNQLVMKISLFLFLSMVNEDMAIESIILT